MQEATEKWIALVVILTLAVLAGVAGCNYHMGKLDGIYEERSRQSPVPPPPPTQER